MLMACAVLGACDAGPRIEENEPRGDLLGEPCQEPGIEQRVCDRELADDTERGVQYCAMNLDDMVEGDPAYKWAACLTEVECTPQQGESCDDGRESVCAVSIDGVPHIEQCFEDDFEGDTPLVLAFSDAPVEFRAMPATGGFDITGERRHGAHDWPTAATPWLAADRDGNGRIDSGAELFGSGTLLGDGTKAADGFAALAEYDSNADGVVSEDDRRFAELVVWTDLDGDKRTDAGELEPLSAFGVSSLPLAYEIDRQCDVRNNCSVEQAAFEFATRGGVAMGRLVDVHLARR